jgi:outer membrane biosynthesis protein TonB
MVFLTNKKPMSYIKYLTCTVVIGLLLLNVILAPALAGVDSSKSSRGTRANEIHIMYSSDLAPIFYNTSDVDVPMLNFSLRNDHGAQTIDFNTVKITHQGSGNAADITAVDLWMDDGDWIFEPGTGDTYLTGGTTWTAGAMTLTAGRTIPANTNETYFVSYNFSASASGTHGASIAADADITASKPVMDQGNYVPILSYNVKKYILPVLEINLTAIYKPPATPTTSFYSGETVIIKAVLNHTWGISGILSAAITITNPNSVIVVNNAGMTDDGSGSDWWRFSYNYGLPVPSPRGTYTVSITGYGKAVSGSQSKNTNINFDVLNEKPQIIGSVSSYQVTEDSTIPTKDLTLQESDLEDKGPQLTWAVSEHDTSIVTITVTDNNLTFALVQHAFGDTKVNLTLTDSDSAFDTTYFWVNVSGENDDPYISPKIQDQQKPEDTPDWVLNLNLYEKDIEDSPSSPALNWSVTGVDAPLDSSRVFIDTGDNLTLSVLPDAFGDENITLTLKDSNGATVQQNVWVNITPVNDAPEWAVIPDLNMTTETMDDAINLKTNVTDIDSTGLTFGLVSSSDINFQLVIDANDKLDITVPTRFNGMTAVNVSVYDGALYDYVEFKIYSTFGQLETELVSPFDGAKVTTQTPQLVWSVIDPEEITEIEYDLYFNINKTLVEDYDPVVRLAEDLTTDTHQLSEKLHNGTVYYWSVLPRSLNPVFTGICKSGVWSFSVDVSRPNDAPTVELIAPRNNETVRNTTVILKWIGQDPNGDYPIYYDVYIGKSSQRDLVENHSSLVLRKGGLTSRQAVITDLEEDEVYVWTVVPNDGDLTGDSVNGTWSFIINSQNYIPEVTLQSPLNNEIVGVDTELAWTYFDGDLFDSVTFDVYLDSDKEKVESLSAEARRTVKDDFRELVYEPSGLFNGVKYFWWVIPYDRENTKGICKSGIWSFIVNASIINKRPVTELLSPKDEAVIYTNSIELTWEGQDLDGDEMSYIIYFSTDRDLVEQKDNKALEISGISTETYTRLSLENNTYYWTVIPSDAKSVGFCKSGVWSFTVQLAGNGNGPHPNGGNGNNVTNGNGDGKKNETAPADMSGAIAGVSIMIIIIILILIFIVIRKRRYDQERAERALAESAELVKTAEGRIEAEGPYLTEEGEVEIPEPPVYEDEDIRPEAEEQPFPIDAGYVDEKDKKVDLVKDVKAKPEAAVKEPVPVPAPTPVPAEAKAEAKPKGKKAVIGKFVEYLKIDKGLATALYAKGFTTVEKVHKASIDELLEVEGVDLNKAATMRLAIANIPAEALEPSSAAPPKPTPAPTPTPTPTPVPTPVPKPVSEDKSGSDETETKDKAEGGGDNTCTACGFPLEEWDKNCPICETPIK